MIYLMRHGQDDENYIGGWSDVSLIPEGIEGVKETALWIKDNLNIEMIVCSDVKRAMQTAEIVSEILDVSYISSSLFREQNKGLLNGVLKTEADETYGKLLATVDKDTVYPQGESLTDLYNRVKELLPKLLEMDDNTLVITHRGVINMIYYLFNDKELDMNKKQFKVVTASLHELDKLNKTIKRIK